MPEPLTHVRQISHIAYGFMASQALFAALNIGLFGHISSGKRTLEELCALTGIAEPRLKTLMAVLVSLGLVVREEDGFTNAPATERYLVPSAHAYFGDYYRFQIDRQIYHYMPHVHAGLAGDPGGLAHESMGGLLADPRNARDFSKAQHAGSLGPAKLMAERIGTHHWPAAAAMVPARADGVAGGAPLRQRDCSAGIRAIEYTAATEASSCRRHAMRRDG